MPCENTLIGCLCFLERDSDVCLKHISYIDEKIETQYRTLVSSHFFHMKPQLHGSVFDHIWRQVKTLALTNTPKASVPVPSLFIDCVTKSENDVFLILLRQQTPNSVPAERNHGSVFHHNLPQVKTLTPTNPSKASVPLELSVPTFFLDCERKCQDDLENFQR